MINTTLKTSFISNLLMGSLAVLSTSLFAADLEIETYRGQLIPEANSAILMTADEALVIDAQFLRPDALAVLSIIKGSGRKLTSILITHGHPDHVWGAVELLKQYPDAKVYARQLILDEIRLEFRARLLRWTEDFPEHLPTSLFDIQPLVGNTFNFSGHEIEVIDLQPAETINATAYYIPELKTYIGGDQIFYKYHAYIGAGLNYPEVWIKSIETIKNGYDIDLVIPGHGPAGDASVLDSAIEYLEEYASVYKPLQKQSVMVRHMLERYPEYGLKEVLFMTIGPAVTAPDLIEMMRGNLGFAEEH